MFLLRRARYPQQAQPAWSGFSQGCIRRGVPDCSAAASPRQCEQTQISGGFVPASTVPLKT
jgi:hypothetical protein